MRSIRGVATRFFALAMLLPPAMGMAQLVPTRVDAPQAGYQRTRVGDVEVIALSDGTKPTQTGILTDISAPDVAALMKKSFEASPYQGSVNAFLFRLDGRLVLIDAGAGELYGPTLNKLTTSLRSAGYAPEQVTDIFITHIHTDHTGGLMDGPSRVFPRAVVHVSQKEIDFWFTPGNRDKAAEVQKKLFDEAKLKFAPYIDAGQVRAFDGATELLPGFRSVPAPGHTPGHTFYTLESKSRTLVFLGDVMNVAEVQLPSPGATVVFDVDPEAAVATRRAAFDDAAARGHVVAFAHMPFPGFGHVGKEGGGYRFYPLRYENDSVNRPQGNGIK